MTAFLVRTTAAMICPHGGTISAITSNTRVLLQGQPAVTQTDTFIVLGCPLRHPCILAKWFIPSRAIRVNGQNVILQDSTGVCQAPDQTPQGPPSIITTQIRVNGK